MRRRAFSRFLLLLLVVAVAALVFKSWGGGAEGVVAMDDFEARTIRSQSLDVSAPTAVEIHAVGSLQSDSVFGAYAWLLQSENRSPVWMMRPDSAQRSRGALAEIREQVTLEPGRYTAYFASFGDPLSPAAPNRQFFDRISSLLNGDFQRWRTESGKWLFEIRVLDDAQRGNVSHLPPSEAGASATALWSALELGNSETREYSFSAAAPVHLTIAACGEFVDAPLDFGWIENLSTGAPVWDMRDAPATPAGGSVKNRRVDAEIDLPPGPYRVVYQTNEQHAFGRWEGNPPYDPSCWGMQVTADPSDAASPFDPWAQLPRIVELTRVGNDALVSEGFTVERPLRVIVEVNGEGSSKMFDYGWLLDRSTDTRVWEMKAEETAPAGGSDKNRRVQALLELQPATYAAFFRTDDSHAYGAWNDAEPDYPERWGLTVFSLDPSNVPESTPLAIDPETGKASDDMLVNLTHVGNDALLDQAFSLTDTTEVHVVSTGEILLRDRFDYGWITRGDRIVWEMTRDNTVYAGGANKNRRFDGHLVLPPGEYVAHFQTDDSHAYGSFSDRPPDDPTAWGILIRRVRSVETIQEGEI